MLPHHNSHSEFLPAISRATNFQAMATKIAFNFLREHFLFKSRACFFVGQKCFRIWAAHVQTRVMKSRQLMMSCHQVTLQKAIISWAFVASLKNKMKTFESRRLLKAFKRWRLLTAERYHFKAKDAFIMMILAKGHAQNLCRFVFRGWVEHANISIARSKMQLAAVQLCAKRNQIWLQGAFVTWIRVKTTGFGVKRIFSDRLRKLFFRWHTFVEYRRSKSLLKSKLHQLSSSTGPTGSPPSTSTSR